MIRIGRHVFAVTMAEMQAHADELVARVEDGGRVVVQRDGRPAAVLLSRREYRALAEAAARLDDLELGLVARDRERAVLDGEDDLVTLDELLREFGVVGRNPADPAG